MSFTFYPPHLTSPKNNNPHYREGSSCLQYLSPKPQRPSQNWLCTRCPTGTPGSSVNTREGPWHSPAPRHPTTASCSNVTRHSSCRDPRGCLLRPPDGQLCPPAHPNVPLVEATSSPWPQPLLLPLPLPPILACSLKRFPSAYAYWSLVWHPPHGLR